MINVSRFIVNAKQRYDNALLEYSFNDLSRMSDVERKTRASNIVVHFNTVDQGQSGHARTFWLVDSQSGKQPYKCTVEIHVPIAGGLFTIAKEKYNKKNTPKKYANVLATSDVKVHCSCPDFYWSGMKYNLGPLGKYKGSLSPNQNSGYKGEKDVVDIAPDTRDPNRSHVMCKHLLAIVDKFPFNAQSIMKKLREYDNNIKINDEVTRDLDQGKKVLNKDTELMEVTDEVKEKIIDPIISATEELDKNQENQGAEEIIQSQDEVKEKTREVPEDVEEVIQDENESKEDLVKEEQNQGAEEIIEKENIDNKQQIIEPLEETEEIIEEENKNKVDEKLEKDDPDNLEDVNQLLGR